MQPVETSHNFQIGRRHRPRQEASPVNCEPWSVLKISGLP
jgi:hypothetical protein